VDPDSRAISRAVDMCQTNTTSHAMNDYDEAVLFTFSLLESRLARLEYLLSGPVPSNEAKPQPIPERIRSIEASLTRLAGKTALLDNVNELRASVQTSSS
jgi:hypothetical protein